ncbi:glycerophosphodiester phosphodiesterase [Conexibacter sp. DBS9H8]|uniref:glycerophosphodiester phosphodiesterase n=1 Tax=Conexibacter sp. DBS9H8 TaxID=2937801 RepID=UPI00200D3818|nr:glycerophosphodiester phosphodiesterase [Conexibacter sp. DBS9H8]
MPGEQCQRIGHGGASALAPANTLDSFDAAVGVGVDMVEFDVRARGRQLVLAHSPLDLHRRDCLTLTAALAHLSLPRFHGVGINLDVKHVGCEAALLEALGHRNLRDRALVSSQVSGVLDRIRTRDEQVLTGISIGGRLARFSRRWADWRGQVLAGLATRRWDALMAQHRLIDPELLAAIRDRDGRLYAWTVNDRANIESLRGLGVDGITSADPRLFAA